MVLLATSCGRIDFVSHDGRDGDAPGDGPGDGAPRTSPCPVGTTAPAPLHITGATIQYTDYQGNFVAIDTVTITAFRGSSALIGMTTSSGTGDFDLSLATAGVPVAPLLVITKGGYATTNHYYDVPLDQAETSLEELQSGSSLDSIYGLASIPRSQQAGTLVIETFDCAGSPVGGVVVDVQPPPEQIAYFLPNGNIGGTATAAPFARAIAYNAVPGITRITATLSGRTFIAQDVGVMSGDAQTLAQLRPVE